MTKRDLMLLAWQFVKDNNMCMRDAMECAWHNEHIIRSMRIGIVEFRFRKLDGSERIARGTLQENRIPTLNGDGRKPHKSVQVFYDVDAEGWRCFKKNSLIKVK